MPKQFNDINTELKKQYLEILKEIKKEYKLEKYPNNFTPNINNKKITAKAYPIQGILKYHGMPDWDLRTAYFSSVSFANDCAYTLTTINFNNN